MDYKKLVEAIEIEAAKNYHEFFYSLVRAVVEDIAAGKYGKDVNISDFLAEVEDSVAVR